MSTRVLTCLRLSNSHILARKSASNSTRSRACSRRCATSATTLLNEISFQIRILLELEDGPDADTIRWRRDFCASPSSRLPRVPRGNNGHARAWYASRVGIIATLLVWLTLAAIGVASAGFWGFLGVAFLYVLYYGLLHPRMTVHVTPQDLAAMETQRAIENAAILGTAAEALRPKRKAPQLPAVESRDQNPTGTGKLYWMCSCGAKNAARRTRCRACDGWSPE